MADILGTLLGIGGNLALGGLNNYWAQQKEENARRENYLYGEMTAGNADQRTRALYKDFYSPEALIKQYQAAGLSPSLMFGGTPGQGGMSGAQGSGASGIGPLYTPMSALEGAQIGNLIAQTLKTKAETANINKDTDLKALQEEWQKMANDQYKTEYTLLNTGMQMPDGSIKSYYDLAGDYKDFDEFIKAARDTAIKAGDQGIIQSLASEQGLRTMRSIYMARQQFSHDISVLSEEKMSAEFQKQILKAMQEEDFSNWNAKAAVAYLRNTVQTQELNERQKEAWNNVLEKLKKTSPTTHDIVIILGSIVNNAMSNWHMPNINNSTTSHTTNVYNK